MVHRLIIRVSMPADKIKRIAKALSVESGREIPRTHVAIYSGKSLQIRIYADDVHALRAAVNSYLRWLNLSLEVEEVIEDGSKSYPNAEGEN